MSVCDENIDEYFTSSNKVISGMVKSPSELTLSDVGMDWLTDDAFGLQSVFDGETQLSWESYFSEDEIFALASALN